MKKLLGITLALAVLVGCKSIPSANTVKTVSTAIGYAAGYACELSKMDDVAKKTIISVVEKVETIVPTEGQTLEAAWTPIAITEVGKLVVEGKLTDTQATFVRLSFGTVISGIDYMFEKHPKWKEHQELVSAGLDGFCTGFKAVLKSSCIDCNDCSDCTVLKANMKYANEMDEDAYKFLKSHKLKYRR